jgi:hypothetical protein
MKNTKNKFKKIIELKNNNIVFYSLIDDFENIVMYNEKYKFEYFTTYVNRFADNITQLENGKLCVFSNSYCLRILNYENLLEYKNIKDIDHTINKIIQLKNGNLASVSDDVYIRIWNKEYECIKKIRYDLYIYKKRFK